MKIFIDVGHGGSETGAVGNGMIEKNINLIVSKEVQRILLLNGQEVKMSRESDITVGLNERCKMANEWDADFFISIHHNANDGNTVGSELYSSIKGGKGSDLATSIAQVFQHYGRHTACIQRESTKNIGQDFYYVIKNTNMPAIITEYGYMDSKDYINFDTEEELILEGRMIAEGILKYLGYVDIVFETAEPTPKHWAQNSYDELIKSGMVIHETRFDDKPSRGELFVLLNRFRKL